MFLQWHDKRFRLRECEIPQALKRAPDNFRKLSPFYV